MSRGLRAVLVIVAAVASGLGLVPRPVLGREAPPVVGREVPVDVSSLVPAGTPAARFASGGVRATRSAWTDPRTTCAPIRFTMLGVIWHQSGEAEVPVRVRWGSSPEALGGPTQLEADPSEGPDPGSPDDDGISGTAPLWTGEARCVRYSLRLPAAERFGDLKLVFINTNGTAHGDARAPGLGDAIVGALGSFSESFAPEPASAMTRRPPIVTREEWDANDGWMNCEIEYADAVKMAYVHHTAGSNDYTRSEAAGVVRGIYWYHTHGRGYCDIAYQFLIDRFGRIYEGRSGGMTEPTIGGHAMGFNTGSVGVSAMGTFSTRNPPRRVIRAFKRLLAWRLDVAFVRPTGHAWMTSAGGSTTRYEEGERVRLDAISGHRDTGITDCPGNRLYRRLDDIREGALGIGLPKMWKPKQSVTRFEAETESVRWTAALSANLKWTIEITDENDAEVRTFSGNGNRIERTWRGRTTLGLPVAPGPYTVRMWGTSPKGRTTRTKTFVVRVTATLPE